MKKNFVETKKGKIYYFKNIENKKTLTIVFLHGLSANHTTWNNITERLSQLKYNTLSIDLRGHGYSDKSKIKSLYKFEMFSEDIKLILQKEKLDNIILVGYSFGGSLAIDFAVRNPDLLRGLILISANHRNPLSYSFFKFLIPVIILMLNLASLITLWQKRKNYHYYKPNEVSGYWRSTWQGLKTMPWSINGWMLIEMAKLNLGKKINLIKVPTVIMHSKHDPFLSTKEIEDMIRKIPQAQIITSTNDSHFIATRAYEEVTGTILNFLKKYENSNF